MNPSIPAELDAIIYKCLAKDPNDRYRNANDLANDLRASLSGLLHRHTHVAQPIVTDDRFRALKRVVTPRRFSYQHSTHGSYFAMLTMLALSLTDRLLPATIPLNLLFIFPLIVITLHCEQPRLILGATALALLLQGLNLASEDIPLHAKIVLALMVVGSDIAVVFLARLARINFLEVEQLSSFDSLTGLRNRLSFETIMDVEVDRHKQKRIVFSFTYIDLHDLKGLNQTRGFEIGDKALKMVALVIRENLRQFDTASRIAGGAFAILMPNCAAAECEAYCKALSAKLAEELQDVNLPISINIGYATFENLPASISEIFDRGESAMHRARDSGQSFAVCA